MRIRFLRYCSECNIMISDVRPTVLEVLFCCNVLSKQPLS